MAIFAVAVHHVTPFTWLLASYSKLVGHLRIPSSERQQGPIMETLQSPKVKAM